MCLALYIASDYALPIVPWDDARQPAFHIQEAVFYPRNPLTTFLSKPFVYSAGSYLGCGCGFEDDAASGQESRRALVEYLVAALQQQTEVEVYTCCSGDECSPPKLRRTARPADFAEYHRALLCDGGLTLVSLHAPEGTSEPAAGLRLQTDPPGAVVNLDGQPLGLTPLASDTLAPGLHSLTVEREGRQSRTWRIQLLPNRTVDLGTVPLAMPGTFVNIWRVGCPHTNDTPPAEIPGALAQHIESLGFHSVTRALPANALVDQFVQAWECHGAAGLPDIVCGTNYLPFGDLLASRAGAVPLVRATGVLRSIGHFAYVLPQSPGYAAAHQIATANQGMTYDSFDWSLDEQWLNELPGKIKSEDDRQILERQNCQAVSAYYAGDLHQIASLLHPDMIGRQGMTHHMPIGDLRTLYVLGNSRLAFVLAAATFWHGQELGCLGTLSVWVRSNDRWQLLIISDDPVGNNSIYDDFPRLAATLSDRLGAPPLPAQLQPPTTQLPSPPDADSYGDFFWTPGSSAAVVAEIAEFHYGDASRLFINPGGQVSVGELWSTGKLWSWRVLTIGVDGQIAVSDTGQFDY